MSKFLKHSISKAIYSIFVLFVLSIAVGKFIQTNSVSLKIDAYFYNLIANGPHNRLLDLLVWPIDNNFFHVGGTNMPSYFIVLLSLFLIYLFFFKRNVFFWAFVTLFISGLIIGSIYSIDSHFIFRQRPYLTLPNHLSESYKNALKSWNSYPSGHARDTAVYSVIIASFIPALAIPLTIFSLFVGWSRVYVGAHFPSDALLGLLIGFVIGKISVVLSAEIKKIYDNKKQN